MGTGFSSSWSWSPSKKIPSRASQLPGRPCRVDHISSIMYSGESSRVIDSFPGRSLADRRDFVQSRAAFVPVRFVWSASEGTHPVIGADTHSGGPVMTYAFIQSIAGMFDLSSSQVFSQQYTCANRMTGGRRALVPDYLTLQGMGGTLSLLPRLSLQSRPFCSVFFQERQGVIVR